MLRTSIDKIEENSFELTKKRSRRYPAKTITDADYLNQAETLLHSLERANTGIGLSVNAHKTEYMCFNQTGDISTLVHLPRRQCLINRKRHQLLSIGYWSYGSQTWPIKWNTVFFQAAVMSMLLYGCTTWTLTKRMEKKLDGNYTRMLRAILNKSWRQHPTKQQLYGHLPPIAKTI